MMEGSAIYLTRRVDLPVTCLDGDSEAVQQYMEDILLEVHRSIDYYENQIGKGMVHQLTFAPAVLPLDHPIAYLREQMNAQVDTFHLESFMTVPEAIASVTQSQCLGAIGAAMRVS